jgi:hypothetical protein
MPAARVRTSMAPVKPLSPVGAGGQARQDAGIWDGRVRQVTGAGTEPAVSCPLFGSRNLLGLTTRDPLFTRDRSSRSLGHGGRDEPDGAVRAAAAT